MNTNQAVASQERSVNVQNGWVMLVLLLGLLVADIALFYARPRGALMAIAVVATTGIIILLTGFFSLQPNEARVLVLFGEYKGTVRESGFHWGNPFYTRGPGISSQLAGSLNKNKLSLRARTLNGEKLKVNDKRGNPVEIAAVVVWRIEDTAQAMFDVDDYETFIPTQSESALRHLASRYSYDEGEENEITLRSNTDEVSQALRTELQERVAKAGLVVDEARLTHLAYAQEIAQAMLRRQQAEAVIAARQKIVHGAVSMVDMALKELSERQIVDLDQERKAAMVSNLLVVLCSESEVHPIVNAGTLYN